MSGGLGPIVVILFVVGLLALVTRWAFGPGYGRTATPAAPGDDGLLVLVATVTAPQTARALRAVLSDTFEVVRQFGSPLRSELASSEIYFVLKAPDRGPRT